MASSRIFIRGLPPSLGDDEFRKHFSQRYAITDAKLFPQRRIGYVGYKDSDEATKAVKYFNKTFINMSRIAVELARPPSDTIPSKSRSGRGIPRDAAPKQIVTHSEGSESVNPLKRKRTVPQVSPTDLKLAEYLDLMGKKRVGSAVEQVVTAAPESAVQRQTSQNDTTAANVAGDSSDEEYQQLDKPVERHTQHRKVQSPQEESKPPVAEVQTVEHSQEPKDVDTAEDDGVPMQDVTAPPATDADWLRSRTSRLLGLLDEDEEAKPQEPPEQHDDSKSDATSDNEIELPEHEDAGAPVEPSTGLQPADEGAGQDHASAEEVMIGESKRLFLRNLVYDVREDDLRAYFEGFGDLEEVHVAVDSRTGKSKGFAYLQYTAPESAISAYNACDGETFQGRLLHILPAAAKRETKLDEYALSKLPLKKQNQIRKKAEAASSSFSWNSLYMNADAVISSVADRLGVEKTAVLDPTSSDAAVKQAIAETHVIQETKTYFLENGVDLEAFKRGSKGDTAILIKNFSYGTKSDDLRKLFEEHGEITRFLMPPSGTIAIVEFTQPTQARVAFASLAYRKLGDSVLFLEKAPKELFKHAVEAQSSIKSTARPEFTTDMLNSASSAEVLDTTTLFVKNLNFTTSSSRLAEAFKPLDGFLSARVKTKTNPKQPEEMLSMGFGFLEFSSKGQAQAALAAMDGYTLDGHQLVIRASQKGMDAAEERRRYDRAKKAASQKSKIVIKNLPFETSKRDVQALLKQYGQLRTVRVPKKFNSTARGFAFAEFTTAKEAANAVEALRNTHLLGRKLVMEYASEDPEDAEAVIQRMQQKIGDQTDKVVLQKLLRSDRQKFNVEGGE